MKDMEGQAMGLANIARHVMECDYLQQTEDYIAMTYVAGIAI